MSIGLQNETGIAPGGFHRISKSGDSLHLGHVLKVTIKRDYAFDSQLRNNGVL
jgi:hypothetical protein